MTRKGTLIRTDVALKGVLYISIPFLQRLCVEARVGNVTCSRKVCSLMQLGTLHL